MISTKATVEHDGGHNSPFLETTLKPEMRREICMGRREA